MNMAIHANKYWLYLYCLMYTASVVFYRNIDINLGVEK